jgi:hypothetical protein
LPPLRAYGPRTRSAPSRLTEVTGIFTTALPMRRIDNRTVRWGTGDLGVSDINSDASLRDEPEPWRAAALAGATSTVRESRAGVEPACAMVRSIRHLHHQRRLSRVIRGRPNDKIALSRRFARCAAIANPLRFALSSVFGSRFVPSDRPALLGTRFSGASPGIRVSRSGLGRDVSVRMSRAFGQQKALRSGWLGRVRIIRLHQSA